MTPTGWSRRWRPVAGWSMPVRSSTIGVRSAPAARTTCGARTTSRHGRPPTVVSASTPVARSPSSRTRVTAASGTIRAPGAPRIREMDPQPGLLRAPPAAEAAPAAVAAADAVALDLVDLLAELRAAAEYQRVLGRDVRGSGHADLGHDRGDVGVELRAVEPVEPVGDGPVAARGRGRGDAGHPVDRRPAADPGAGERHDRGVPRHVEPVVEVQPVEGRELVDRHLGLGQERPGLEHDDRAAGTRGLRGDDAPAGAGAHDHDVGVEDDRLAGGRSCGDGHPGRRAGSASGPR